MRPDHDAESHLTRQAEIPIQLDGGDVPVRYYTVEPGSPESDTTTREETILFVHGLRDNALYFERIARRFASRGFRSFLLELPGYDSRSWGTSVQLAEYTIPVFAQYLQQARTKPSTPISQSHYNVKRVITCERDC